MAIDFTLTPELETIRLRVRKFMDEVVRPTEAKIGDPDELDRAEYIKLLFGMRDAGEGRGPLAPAHARGVGRHGARPRRDGGRVGRGGEDRLSARSC